MARQLTVNKSNFYITGGMYALGMGEDVIVKMLGNKGIKELFSFLAGKIHGSVKRSSDYKKKGFLKHDQKMLFNCFKSRSILSTGFI